jgi:hypothetical protein
MVKGQAARSAGYGRREGGLLPLAGRAHKHLRCLLIPVKTKTVSLDGCSESPAYPLVASIKITKLMFPATGQG